MGDGYSPLLLEQDASGEKVLQQNVLAEWVNGGM